MARGGIGVSNRTLHDIYCMPSTVELGGMGLPLDSQIREICRWRLAGDEAIACKVALFATWVLDEDFDPSHSSIYTAMEAKGTRAIRVLQEISASAADTLVATSLGIEPGLPHPQDHLHEPLHLQLGAAIRDPYFRADGDAWIMQLKR
jgi:DNA-binding GntR family transcriptional regulator